MRFPYRPLAAAGAERIGEILIYGDIGASWYAQSVDAGTLVTTLQGLKGTIDRLIVRINSWGGAVTDGTAIYSALRALSDQGVVIETWIEGAAVSIASLIAEAGDVVKMAKNAMYMVHAPWGSMAGNASQLREYADLLDRFAEAMATSYMRKTGKDHAAIIPLLTDGVDHWYLASEAKDFGFVDEVTEEVNTATQAASFAEITARFPRNIPAALAAYRPKENPMPENPNPPPANQTPPPAPANPPPPVDEAEIEARILARETQRRNDIQVAFAPFASRVGVPELLAQCQADPKCSADTARERLLAKLGQGAKPISGSSNTVEPGQDARDKFRVGAKAALLVRAGIRTQGGKPIDLAGNEFRAHKLMDLARFSLEAAGVSLRSYDQREIVAAAFQSTSDFPVLLTDTFRTSVLEGYTLVPVSWRGWCKVGSVGDFREWARVTPGLIGTLDPVGQNGEIRHRALPDGEKQVVKAGTAGNIVGLTRQVVINDDLGAFLGTGNELGMAAARTIERDAYRLLALNNGQGPLLKDGLPLFHSAHGNLAATAENLSADALENGRVAMATQLDPAGEDFVGVVPEVLACRTIEGGEARVIISSQYDPDADARLNRVNKVYNLVRTIVDTPRIARGWYLFGNPAQFPCVEVVFLDGNENPLVEEKDGWDTDGVEWKVLHDFGVGAISHRGGFFNPGAAAPAP